MISNKYARSRVAAFLMASVGAAAAYAATTSTAATGGQTSAGGITVVPAATGTFAPLDNASASSTASGATAADEGAPFVLGAQTHFSQGWNSAVLGLANQVGATYLRDSVPWGGVEKKVGDYDFSAAYIQTLQTFCTGGGKISLTIVPQNAIYDGGSSVFSDQGRLAYANYLNALLARLPGCVNAIEVGNEVNTASNLPYPSNYDPTATYVSLLKTVRAVVKPRFPGVAILGGSTNVVGTGYLAGLFAAGALPLIDGVAIHPYRPNAEGLDVELANLRSVMSQYGKPVPIWATEFSFDTTDQRQGAASLAKMAAMLAAGGVDHASWYAVLDQSFFPTMGLFNGTAMKSQGVAFQAITKRLLAYGRAARVNTGDNLVYLYRFGTDRWLVWGAPRAISFAGSPMIRDVLGNVIAGTTAQIGDEPVMVEGATGYSFGASPAVADTLLQWGQAPWSYFRLGTDGKYVALPALFDNAYTSYYGDRWSKPLRINVDTAAVAGTGAAPIRAIMRYTAPAAAELDLEACFGKAVSGDGVDYRIEKNGVAVRSGVLTDRVALHAVPIGVSKGDRIDVSFGPNQTAGGDAFNYRVTLSQRGRAQALSCK